MYVYRTALLFLVSLFSLIAVGSAFAKGDLSRQACIPVQPEGWGVYSVQTGDTLADIAAATGSTIDELMRVNCVGISRRLAADQRFFVPRPPESPPDPFLRRCLNADFTEQECRRIYNALHDSDAQPFAQRCLDAGYTAQQCRRIYNALFGDDSALPERCRAAGLTPEQCRRLVNASPDSDLAARCRVAGLTPEQCRRLVNAAAGGDVVRPEDRLQLQSQTRPEPLAEQAGSSVDPAERGGEGNP